MCTSFLMRESENSAIFGRNMDLFYPLDFEIAITPRHYPLPFRKEGICYEHYALIGMAVVKDGYPLYCEAANEKGLAVAGLDFPVNAFYSDEINSEKHNISPFELIPFVLSHCSTVAEAKALLDNTNIISESFSEELPIAPLHWHIADREHSIVFEATRGGQRIFENPINVMTNNPPFDFHLNNLSQYLNLSPEKSNGAFAKLGIKPFSFGSGGIGLPGDLSSASRFIRAAFFLSCSKYEKENEIPHAFRLLSSVAMPKGSVITESGAPDMTLYSACMDLCDATYYITSYENPNIRAIRLTEERAESNTLLRFAPFEKMSPHYLP